MKVYTVQPVDFLQSVDSEGFIYPKKRYTELSVFFVKIILQILANTIFTVLKFLLSFIERTFYGQGL